MKIQKYLLAVLPLFLLSSCGHQHIDENKDHLCDNCKEKISDHINQNNDHLCDYCGATLTKCVDEDLDGKCDICGEDIKLPYDYAEWPINDVQALVKTVTGSNVVIPAYKRADDIEIDTDAVESDGYFAIYCYTENMKSEDEYKDILLEAQWMVSIEKENNYYQAFDPSNKVWLNFAYNPNYTDLEIYVAKAVMFSWPEKDIADAVQDIAPGTTTVIPEFEAYIYEVNYYSDYKALAINAYGYKDTIINDYKATLEDEEWVVSFNDVSKEWNAISNAKDIEIHFYIDEAKGQFNVDVLSYTPPVEGWPYEEIATVVSDMGATGVVLPFTGKNDGFEVNTDYYPPAIYIFCESSAQSANAAAYNQYLLDNGYVYVGDMYGDPMYAYPGTTLAYRAVVLVGVLQIELFKLSEPAK